MALLCLLNVGSSVREALEGELPEGRHVGAVAGHQEQLGGALRPRVQTRVQAQLHPLVVARGPITAAAGSWFFCCSGC